MFPMRVVDQVFSDNTYHAPSEAPVIIKHFKQSLACHVIGW